MAYNGLIFSLMLGAMLSMLAASIVGQLAAMPQEPLLTSSLREGQKSMKQMNSKQAVEDNRAESLLCHHPLVGLEQNFCAPRVFIGGAMKCGTNEVMRILALHPRARFNTCPDPRNRTECNNVNYQGIRDHEGRYHIWESQHLPEQYDLHAIANRLPDTDGQNTVTFDKTPRYFNTDKWHDIPSHMRQMMPGTKMIFTVCDPAERLFSEFNHLRRLDGIKLSPTIPLPQNFPAFMEILNETADICGISKEECTKASERLLRKGHYSEHLKKWLEVYPKSDILVLEMEAGTIENAKKLLDFAGLPDSEYPWDDLQGEPAYRNTYVNGYNGREVAWTQYPEEMKSLSSIFSESNLELADMLDAKFPLDWRSSKVPNK